MQPPTLPPWLSPWSTGLLYGQRRFNGALRERYRPRDRHRPRLTIYTYNHDDSHILRIGGWGRGSSPHTARPAWERYPADREPWHLAVPPPLPPDFIPNIYTDVSTGKVAPSPYPRPPRPEPRESWGGAARGWVAGTTLLALLVLLARAAEKCIDKRFFKRRRRSQEWPTPTVYATSHQQNHLDLRPIDGAELPLDTVSLDLPPPYSECGTSSQAVDPKLPEQLPEEPPPPYSDCYVEFSNKNGIPSVLIFSRRRNSIFNRHEIVGNRPDDASCSSAIDSSGAIVIEEVRAENRAAVHARAARTNAMLANRNAITINDEHRNAISSNDSTAIEVADDGNPTAVTVVDENLTANSNNEDLEAVHQDNNVNIAIENEVESHRPVYQTSRVEVV